MIRKKIGSNKNNISLEDDVDFLDSDDLEQIASIGESDISEDNDRYDVLSSRALEFRNNRSFIEDAVVENSVNKHGVECTCNFCMKSFFRKENSIVWMCPYCGHKYEVEDLEEVNTLQDNPYKDIVQSDQRAKDRKRRFQNVFQRRSETWQDGRKEQLSLEMGSDEYGEYIDDLARNNPENSDDTFHDKLEQHNEDLVTKQYDTPQENPETAKLQGKAGEDSVSVQKREEMQKRNLHAVAVREAIAAASLTESLTDDQLARAITTDNEILYNKSVKPDEYVEALKDYVVGPSL